MQTHTPMSILQVSPALESSSVQSEDNATASAILNGEVPNEVPITEIPYGKPIAVSDLREILERPPTPEEAPPQLDANGFILCDTQPAPVVPNNDYITRQRALVPIIETPFKEPVHPEYTEEEAQACADSSIKSNRRKKPKDIPAPSQEDDGTGGVYTEPYTAGFGGAGSASVKREKRLSDWVVWVCAHFRNSHSKWYEIPGWCLKTEKQFKQRCFDHLLSAGHLPKDKDEKFEEILAEMEAAFRRATAHLLTPDQHVEGTLKNPYLPAIWKHAGYKYYNQFIAKLAPASCEWATYPKYDGEFLDEYYAVEPKWSQELRSFLEFCEQLLGESEVERFHDVVATWMYYITQPSDMPIPPMVLVGDEGSGKTLILRMLASLAGACREDPVGMQSEASSWCNGDKFNDQDVAVYLRAVDDPSKVENLDPEAVMDRLKASASTELVHVRGVYKAGVSQVWRGLTALGLNEACAPRYLCAPDFRKGTGAKLYVFQTKSRDDMFVPHHERWGHDLKVWIWTIALEYKAWLLYTRTVDANGKPHTNDDGLNNLDGSKLIVTHPGKRYTVDPVFPEGIKSQLALSNMPDNLVSLLGQLEKWVEVGKWYTAAALREEVMHNARSQRNGHAGLVQTVQETSVNKLAAALNSWILAGCGGIAVRTGKHNFKEYSVMSAPISK